MIDFKFIQSLEGKHILNGYVPQREGKAIGNSGVTISSGVDLGQLGVRDLIRLFAAAGLKEEDVLLRKLSFYCNLKQDAAIDYLVKNPLEITEVEAKILDNLFYENVVRWLSAKWYNFSMIHFHLLPGRVQTILFSLAWNLGDIFTKLPTTMEYAKRSAIFSDWAILHNALDKFPSKQKELEIRRKKEANYLLPLVNPG